MPLSLANGSKVNKALLEAEKKNGLYVCTKCDKKFARLDSLKQHLGTHDQNFALQCPMCEMTFGWASTLRRHKGFQITLALKILEPKLFVMFGYNFEFELAKVVEGRIFFLQNDMFDFTEFWQAYQVVFQNAHIVFVRLPSTYYYVKS